MGINKLLGAGVQALVRAVRPEAAAPRGQTPALQASQPQQLRDAFQQVRPALMNLTGASAFNALAKSEGASGGGTRGVKPLVDPELEAELLGSTHDAASLTHNILNNPDLTQEQKDYLVAKLAADPANANIFFTGQGPAAADPASQQAVADALGRVYAQGDVTDAQLQALCDAAGMNNVLPAEQYLMQLWSTNPANTAAGGPIDKFGQHLLATAPEGPEGDEMRLAAYLGLTATPELSDTIPAEQRADAFVAVNELLQGDYFELLGKMNPEVAERLEEQTYVNTATFYSRHGAQIVQELTAVPQSTGPNAMTGDEYARRLGVLSEFYTQFLFSPKAQEMTMPGGGTVSESVEASSTAITESLMRQLEGASTEQEQNDVARSLGVMSATVAEGADLAMRRYRSEIADNEKLRDRIAGIFGSLAGAAVPSGAVPGTGKAVEEGVKALVKEALERWVIEDPDKPGTSLAQDFLVSMLDQISQYQDSQPTGSMGAEGPRSNFEDGYNTTRNILEDLWDNRGE